MDKFHDADSRVLPDGRTTRQVDIAAPEVANPHAGTPDEFLGPEARDFAQKLSDTFGLTNEPRGTGFYGRPLEKSTLGNGQDLGETLVRNGFAQSQIGAPQNIQDAQKQAALSVLMGEKGQAFDAFRNAHFDPSQLPNPNQMTATRPSLFKEGTLAAARGVDQLQQAGGGLVSYLGDLANSDTLRNAGKNYAESQNADLALRQPSVPKSSDIHSLNDLAHFVVGTVGEQVPQIAVQLGALATGGAPAAAAAIALQHLGDTQHQLNQRGLNEREGAVATSAVLKAIPDMLGFRAITHAGGAKGIAKAVAIESGTGGVQALEDQRFLEAQDPTYHISDADLWDAVKESTIKSAVGGGAFATVHAGLQKFGGSKKPGADGNNQAPGGVPLDDKADVVPDGTNVVTTSEKAGGFDPETNTVQVPSDGAGDPQVVAEYIVEGKAPEIVNSLSRDIRQALGTKPSDLQGYILTRAIATKKRSEVVGDAVRRILENGVSEPEDTPQLRAKRVRDRLMESRGLQSKDASLVLTALATQKKTPIEDLGDLDNIGDQKTLDRLISAASIPPTEVGAVKKSGGEQLGAITQSLADLLKLPKGVGTRKHVADLAESFGAAQRVSELGTKINELNSKIQSLREAKKRIGSAKNIITSLNKRLKTTSERNPAEKAKLQARIEEVQQRLADANTAHKTLNDQNLHDQLVQAERARKTYTQKSARFVNTVQALSKEGKAGDLGRALQDYVTTDAQMSALERVDEARRQAEFASIQDAATSERLAAAKAMDAVKEVKKLEGAKGSDLANFFDSVVLKSREILTNAEKAPIAQKVAEAFPKESQDVQEALTRAYTAQLARVQNGVARASRLKQLQTSVEPGGKGFGAPHELEVSTSGLGEAPGGPGRFSDIASGNVEDPLTGFQTNDTVTTRLIGQNPVIPRVSPKTGRLYNNRANNNSSVEAAGQLIHTDSAGDHINLSDLPESTVVTDNARVADESAAKNTLVYYRPRREGRVPSTGVSRMRDTLAAKDPRGEYRIVQLRDKAGRVVGHIIHTEVSNADESYKDTLFYKTALSGAGARAKNVFKKSALHFFKPGEKSKLTIDATKIVRAGLQRGDNQYSGLAPAVARSRAFLDALAKMRADGWELATPGVPYSTVLWQEGGKAFTYRDLVQTSLSKGKTARSKAGDTTEGVQAFLSAMRGFLVRRWKKDPSKIPNTAVLWEGDKGPFTYGDLVRIVKEYSAVPKDHPSTRAGTRLRERFIKNRTKSLLDALATLHKRLEEPNMGGVNRSTVFWRGGAKDLTYRDLIRIVRGYSTIPEDTTSATDAKDVVDSLGGDTEISRMASKSQTPGGLDGVVGEADRFPSRLSAFKAHADDFVHGLAGIKRDSAAARAFLKTRASKKFVLKRLTPAELIEAKKGREDQVAGPLTEGQFTLVEESLGKFKEFLGSVGQLQVVLSSRVGMGWAAGNKPLIGLSEKVFRGSKTLKISPAETTSYILGHEFGHQIDYERRFSKSPEWGSAAVLREFENASSREDLPAMAILGMNHAKKEFPSAAITQMERFADAFSLSINYPEIFNEHFPKTSSLLIRTTIVVRAKPEPKTPTLHRGSKQGRRELRGTLGRNGETAPTAAQQKIIDAVKARRAKRQNRVAESKPPVSISASTLQKVISEFKSQFKGLDISFVDRQSELTSDKRVVVAQVEGNRVILVRENIGNRREATRALRHEVVGHLGIRKVLGKDFEAEMRRVVDSIKDNAFLRDLYAGIKELYPNASHVEIGDEMLAFAAETHLNVGVFRQIWDRLATAFRQLFSMKTPMTKTEVMDLVASAERALQRDGVSDINSPVRNKVSEDMFQATKRLLKSATNKASVKLESTKVGTELMDMGGEFKQLLRDASPLIRSLTPRVKAMEWEHKDWFAAQFDHTVGETERSKLGVGSTIPAEIRRRMNPIIRNQLSKAFKALPKKPSFLKQRASSAARAEAERIETLRKDIAETLIKQTPLREITNPEVKKAVEGVREYLSYMHTYLTKTLGLKIPWRSDYFPLVVNRDKVEANRGEVIDIIKGTLKIGDKAAQDVYNNLLTGGDLLEMEMVDPTSPQFNFMKSRTLPVELSRALSKYYLGDIESILLRYTKAGVKKGVFEGRFGQWTPAKNPTPENPDGVSTYDPMGKLKLRMKLMSDAERAFILNTALPAYSGVLGAKMPERWRKFNSYAITYLNYRLLPLALFANMVDVGGTVIRNEGFVEPMKQAWKVASDKQYREQLFESAHILGVIRDDIMDHITTEQAGFMSGTSRVLNDALFKYNGMRLWTDISRIISLATAREALKDYAKRAKAGDARAIQDLRELQVTSAHIDAWASEGMPMNGHSHVNRALDRWVDGAIVRPHAGIRPGWASDHRAVLAWYLKGYMWGIYETLLKRVYHNMSRREGFDRLTPAIYATLATVPLAMAGYAVRQAITGGSTPDDEEDWLMKGLIRSGMLGPAQLPLDMSEADTRGHLAMFALLGPAGTIFEDLFSEGLTGRTVASAIPFVNQRKDARDWVDASVDGVLGW